MKKLKTHRFGKWKVPKGTRLVGNYIEDCAKAEANRNQCGTKAAAHAAGARR